MVDLTRLRRKSSFGLSPVEDPRFKSRSRYRPSGVVYLSNDRMPLACSASFAGSAFMSRRIPSEQHRVGA